MRMLEWNEDAGMQGTVGWRWDGIGMQGTMRLGLDEDAGMG